MRRKPGSTLVARIVPEDPRRRCTGGLRTRSGLQDKPRKADIRASREAPKSGQPRPLIPKARATLGGPQVVDDFPEVMPVTHGELDVVETYLGTLLDEMLRRME
jgi:hypothetical protein